MARFGIILITDKLLILDTSKIDSQNSDYFT